MKYLLYIFTFTFLMLSCKKKDTIPCEESESILNVAPCEIEEKSFHLDSVFYGGSSKYPQAKFRLRFYFDSTNLNDFREYAFNQTSPATGKYRVVNQIDTTNSIDNQIAWYKPIGSFYAESLGTEYPEIYIENNQEQLIISYCNITHPEFIFVVNNNSYGSCRGNGPDTNLLIRKQY